MYQKGRQTVNKRFLVTVACVVLLLSSCAVGSRRVVTSDRSVSGFDRVVFEGLGELTITQGDRESLTIEAESNVMSRITTEVRGGTLYIDWRAGVFGFSVVPTKPLRYDLTMKDVRVLSLTGLGSLAAGEISTDRLDVGINGGGRVVIRSLRAADLDLGLTGLGQVEVGGAVDRQSIVVTGGGEYDGSDLESGVAAVTITGLGKATVWATESLDVELPGAGVVEYYGEPTVTQNVSGLGSVRSLGPR